MIAGDFLSLLSERRLQPISPVVFGATGGSGGLAGCAEATTVFAMHYAEGVLMVGDRRATAGNVIVTDQVEKVIELDASTVLAIAGVPAMAFEMARVLRTSFEYYRRSQLQPMSLAAKVRATARLLRENLPLTMQGVGVVVPLLSGVDVLAGGGRPSIFFYDPLGAQFQAAGYAASGSGAASIRSLLSFQERFGDPKPLAMKRDEAVRFALRALTVAAEFDSATAGVSTERGWYATMRILTHAGIDEVAHDEQEALMPA